MSLFSVKYTSNLLQLLYIKIFLGPEQNSEVAGEFIKQMFFDKIEDGRSVFAHYTCANGKHLK